MQIDRKFRSLSLFSHWNILLSRRNMYIMITWPTLCGNSGGSLWMANLSSSTEWKPRTDITWRGCCIRSRFLTSRITLRIFCRLWSEGWMKSCDSIWIYLWLDWRSLLKNLQGHDHRCDIITFTTEPKIHLIQVLE